MLGVGGIMINISQTVSRELIEIEGNLTMTQGRNNFHLPYISDIYIDRY